MKLIAQALALDFIIGHEGGYVNNPKDPGGATNYGISFRFLKELAPELGDIDGDGDVDIDDIKALTPKKAQELYTAEFWDKLQLGLLPGDLAVATMDAAVNQGKLRAVRHIQSALCDCKHQVKVDGSLGPITRAAIRSCSDKYLLLQRAMFHRVWCYREVVMTNRKLGEFLLGWLNRMHDLDYLLHRF